MNNSLLRLRSYVSVLTIFVLLVSLFFEPIGIQANNNENSSENIEPSYLRVTVETDVLDDNEKIIGKLLENTILQVKKIEGDRVYFQWDEDLAFVSTYDVEILPEADNISWTDPVDIEKLKQIVFTKDTEVQDRSNNELIAVIAGGETYSVVEEDEHYYYIIIGHRQGAIKKEQLLETTEEGQTEQPSNSVEEEQEENPQEETSENDFQSKSEEKLQIQSEQTSEIRLFSAPTSESNLEKNEDNQENQLEFTKTDKYFEVIEENIPVYDNRTGKLVKIGELEKGQVYPRVSDYGNWHRIQFSDHYGYVKKSLTKPADGTSIKNENKSYQNSSQSFKALTNVTVYDNTSGKLVPFGKIEKGKDYKIATDYGNWWRIIYSDRIGYVKKSEVQLQFSKSDKYFEVIEDNIPVYDNRTGKLVKIGELEKGQVYPRVSDYGNWHRIQFSDYYGYVHKRHTKPILKSPLKNENTKYKSNGRKITAINDVTVYDNSTGKLVPFGTIEKGIDYKILSDYGNWWRVVYSGRIGYVKKSEMKADFLKTDKYFKVTVDNLTVYDNSTGKLVKIGELRNGQVYERVSDYGNWHRIQFGERYGYVKKSATVVGNRTSIKNFQKSNNKIGVLTTKENVLVYDNTGTKLIPFATIMKGERHPVISDYGNWYEVNVSGRYGYVKKNLVEYTSIKNVNVVNPLQVYTYEKMEKDIKRLKEIYPDIIHTEIIGKSVDGRNIYALKLGKGKTEIFMNGSHHAREWITTNLLMEMIDEYSRAYRTNSSIDGYNVRKILNNTSIWYVPMVNPDGVTLVQLGHKSAKNPDYVLKINGGKTDFSAWKANIRGVDLNRQYPAGWETIKGDPGKPSPQNYKGPKPLSEPETKAMYNFTLKHNFKTAVSYHSSGEILYWDYKTSGTLKSTARKIADMISKKTGYSLVFPGPNPSGGGYTDWFEYSIKRPAFTPEVSPYVGPRPVPLSNFSRIWEQNKSIGLMLAEEAYNR
jgi:murein tripeptide amidase MpaA